MKIDFWNVVAIIVPIILAWWLNRRSVQSGTYKNLSDVVRDLSNQIKEVKEENKALDKRLDQEIEIRKVLEEAIRERDKKLYELQKEFDALKAKYERERKEWISKK